MPEQAPSLTMLQEVLLDAGTRNPLELFSNRASLPEDSGIMNIPESTTGAIGAALAETLYDLLPKAPEDLFLEVASFGALPPGSAGSLRGTGRALEDFYRVGRSQRNVPEMAMKKAQHEMGSGVMSHTIENVGDITHRMADEGTFTATAGYEFVKKKILNALETLKSGYGFEREFMENLASTAELRGTDAAEFVNRSLRTLDDYAAAHRSIPTINEAQNTAKEAAVALGERRYTDAIDALEELKNHLGSAEEWKQYAQQGLVLSE